MSARTGGALLRRDRPAAISPIGRMDGGRGDATGLARDREATDYRDVVSVLIFSLLALNWLAVTRNVRVGPPGDLNAPSRAAAGAGATSPGAGMPHTLTAGPRPGSRAFGPD